MQQWLCLCILGAKDKAGKIVLSISRIGPASSDRAVLGALATELAPSSATYLDREASFEVELIGSGLTLSDTTVDGLAVGENRILVGEEIIQFLHADQLTDNRWAISGLLRGRAGTEFASQQVHPTGTMMVLLDDRLTTLDPSIVPSSQSTAIAAIGLGDENPVTAILTSSGATRRPLSPVHARYQWQANGDLALCWTRRARGQWDWPDYVDAPVIEEALRFRVGYGPVSAAYAEWDVDVPELTLNSATVAQLIATHGPGVLHVSQVGTFGRSPTTRIAQLA